MARPAKRPILPSDIETADSLSSPYIIVTLLRKVSQRTNDVTIRGQVDDLLDSTLTGDRNKWQVDDVEKEDPYHTDGFWHFKFTVTLTRKTGRRENTAISLSNEKRTILATLRERCVSTKFGKYPWEITSNDCSWNETPAITSDEKEKLEDFSVSDIVDFNCALTWDDIDIPEVLINGSNDEIESHPAFKGIFGRGPHIRVIWSSIKRAKETNGMKRNHCLLWGLPACAKSQILLATQEVIGKGGYLTLNANSATKAGIEKIFLKRLRETGTPPIVFIEEIEKTLEAILTVWLSILDDRGEVRKVTNNDQMKADARVLVVGTANDKVWFDRLMGGRPGYPGALSSRFTKKLYVPRPSEEIMRRILLRDIETFGGKKSWVNPCIDIMKELQTNDPRTVLSLLDGGDRLLTGEYKEDILEIHRLEKEQASSEEDFDPEE